MSAWTSGWSGKLLAAMALATLPVTEALADSTQVTAAAPVAAPAAAFEPGGQVSLKVFSEWFYDFADGVDKTSGFDLTRAYFGYKYDFSANLAGNVTLDVGRSNEIVTAVYDTATRSVKTTTDTRYKAFLKTASLKLKGAIPRTTIEGGVVGTNLFSAPEKFWGYRYVFKSFMDQNGFGSSADLGAKASVQIVDFLGLNLEVLNGEGFTKPQDAFGNYLLTGSLDLKLPVGIVATAYYDYLPLHDLEAQSNISGFLGYAMKDVFRIGAEYDMQIANKGVADHDLSGFSGYAAYILNKQFEVFARFDMLQSTDDWNVATDGQTIIGGVHYSPAKGVKVAVDYQGFTPAASGADPKPKAKLNLEYSL